MNESTERLIGKQRWTNGKNTFSVGKHFSKTDTFLSKHLFQIMMPSLVTAQWWMLFCIVLSIPLFCSVAHKENLKKYMQKHLNMVKHLRVNYHMLLELQIVKKCRCSQLAVKTSMDYSKLILSRWEHSTGLAMVLKKIHWITGLGKIVSTAKKVKVQFSLHFSGTTGCIFENELQSDTEHMNTNADNLALCD